MTFFGGSRLSHTGSCSLEEDLATNCYAKACRISPLFTKTGATKTSKSNLTSLIVSQRFTSPSKSQKVRRLWLQTSPFRGTRGYQAWSSRQREDFGSDQASRSPRRVWPMTVATLWL